jgi:hypothetical protein
MGTHCTIAIINDDNTISMTRADSDGYVREPGVGSTLVKYYTDYNIVKELIGYGDVANLGKKLHPTGTEHSIDFPEDEVCCFFLRDSDDYEEDDEYFTTDHFLTVQEYEQRIEGWRYNYLFEDGEWYIISNNKKMLVKDHPDYDGTSEPTAHSTVRNSFNNEKLLELAKQADDIHDKYYLQVFAELIIKECIENIEQFDHHINSAREVVPIMVSQVKQHFGVE